MGLDDAHGSTAGTQPRASTSRCLGLVSVKCFSKRKYLASQRIRKPATSNGFLEPSSNGLISRKKINKELEVSLDGPTPFKKVNNVVPCDSP